MTLRLYFGPGACSFVPHVLLELSGANYEAVMVKLHKGEQYADDYKAINPRSQVPVLVDEHGETITQILAIVGYLNDRFPDAHFLPVEALARARVMQTLAWMNNTVHPTFTHIFMPGKYSDRPELHDELRRFSTQMYRAQLQELDDSVATIKATGATWLGGPQPGPVDAYALTLLRWGSMAGLDPQGYPQLWAHVQQLAQVPAVARVIARERLQLNLYKPG